jgi:small GTP-binding protein
MSRTQKNKATEYHLGQLKAKLAKLRTELLAETKGGGGPGQGEGFSVERCGDGRVALIGFPSVGKSSLLNELTDTKSVAAAYEFTTLTCIPGNLYYNDTRIQLLDLPGIIEGAAHGKGRGREVIAVAKSADLILMVLDAGAEHKHNHRAILENELETVGLRLNKSPPNIYFRKKAGGGVKFNATCTLTKLGENPQRTAEIILKEYKHHNCELLIREDCTSDELIDVIEGNRKYIPCLYLYNKIDTIGIEDVDRMARKPDSTVLSVHMKLNIDTVLAKMWEYMGLTRVYTKKRGAAPMFDEPVVLSGHRRGTSVEACVKSVSADMLKYFNYCLVWGTSTKYSPQRVGLTHVLQDRDVLQVVTKTVTQQRHDKNYAKVVQDYYDEWHRKKKKGNLKT